MFLLVDTGEQICSLITQHCRRDGPLKILQHTESANEEISQSNTNTKRTTEANRTDLRTRVNLPVHAVSLKMCYATHFLKYGCFDAMNDISVLHLSSNIQFGVQEHCLEIKLN